MQINNKEQSSTTRKLTIEASAPELERIKKHTLEHFRAKTKVPGFRAGKAPLTVLEKHLDSSVLQTEFLDEAVNTLYHQALDKEGLRPVGNPQISIIKFVPFTVLEFEAELEVLGDVKLADYKKIRKTKPKPSVVADDVSRVVEDLRQRAAERKEVSRAAKSGDELIIDFDGSDEKSKPINGASGKDYPLTLGSDAFIPGFEDNLMGLKPGETKTFTITFPKNYSVKALSGKKATFKVGVKKVQEIIRPKLDDTFAAKVGPFKNMSELKADIKKQLLVEKQNQVDRQFENDIIQEIVSGSEVDLPKSLVSEQVDRLKTEVRQNLAYRGQTWQEMLEAEGLKEDEYQKQVLVPEAEQRVKTGLVLAEISAKEKLEADSNEIDERLEMLRAQYNDAGMQAELAKPGARRDIASRILTEKTVARLVQVASAK